MGAMCVWQACELGSFTNTAGNTACFLCPPGSYSGPLGASQCLPCPLGSASAAGQSTCSNCTAGRYSPSLGQAVCRYPNAMSQVPLMSRLIFCSLPYFSALACPERTAMQTPLPVARTAKSVGNDFLCFDLGAF
jgi:hypothetical protein